jgi:hypothetical protein
LFQVAVKAAISRQLCITSSFLRNDSHRRKGRDDSRDALGRILALSKDTNRIRVQFSLLAPIITYETSFRSENRFSRYLQRTASVFATEFLAAVRCGFVSVAETADLAQVHSFLQVADC